MRCEDGGSDRAPPGVRLIARLLRRVRVPVIARLVPEPELTISTETIDSNPLGERREPTELGGHVCAYLLVEPVAPWRESRTLQVGLRKAQTDISLAALRMAAFRQR